MSRIISRAEMFILRSKNIHENLYDYSRVKYVGTHIPVEVICSIHGSFNILPSVHASKKAGGCPVCGMERMKKNKQGNVELFIKNATQKHGNYYDYTQVVYVNNYTKVKIICPHHGKFQQLPYAHTCVGRGCPKCANAKKGSKTGRLPIKHQRETLYVLKCFDGKESFIKIGITERPLKTRLSRLPYKYEILDFVGGVDSRSAFLLEQQILKQMRNQYSYVPEHKFCGYTECLTYNDEVINRLKQHIEGIRPCQD